MNVRILAVVLVLSAGLIGCDHPFDDASERALRSADALRIAVERQKAEEQAAPLTLEEEVHYVHAKVISDIIHQWQIVSAGDSRVVKCVVAGELAQAYLQAGDAVGYHMMQRHARINC